MLRFLRLALLVVTLLVAAAAQFIFDRGALSAPAPASLVQQLPWLAQAAGWRAGEFATLALWGALAAGLIFGLVTPN